MIEREAAETPIMRFSNGTEHFIESMLEHHEIDDAAAAVVLEESAHALKARDHTRGDPNE